MLVLFRPWLLGLVPLTFATLLLSLPQNEGAEPPPKADFAKDVQPLLKQFCAKCHTGENAEAEVDFNKFSTLADLRKSPKTWQKIAEVLDTEQMPPREAKQPSNEQKQLILNWVKSFLKQEAQSRAGDPGKVVLRRLSNAEYTYTIQDLTGINTLQPAREFPIDGAAGEGFTNSGEALVMSPALLDKYLEAAKGIANHAVLLPEGIRFSSCTTRQDHTNEALASIRQLYAKYADPSGGTTVQLQGLTWNGQEGGRLPIEKYLLAALEERDNLKAGKVTLQQVATSRQLSQKYLETLWQVLTTPQSSVLLQGVQKKWQASTPATLNTVVDEVSRWQKALWKFNPVGHVGKLDGPKSWLEAVNPLRESVEIKYKLPAQQPDPVLFYLNNLTPSDKPVSLTWQSPRFVAPGKPEVLLKDIPRLAGSRLAAREETVSKLPSYLRAVQDYQQAEKKPNVAQFAEVLGLKAELLDAWLNYLGVASPGPVVVKDHLKNKIDRAGTYAFIQGWGVAETPTILANSSDTLVRVPGRMYPHGVSVHPSPTLNIAVGWQSPIAGKVELKPMIQHAHPECGNGVTWSLEHRRGGNRTRLANGIAQGGTPAKVPAIPAIDVQKGDLVSLVIGPRDGNHACDLTDINLQIQNDGKLWSMSSEISKNITKGNPQADSFNNPDVWHFYTEPTTITAEAGSKVPVGSLFEEWQKATPELKIKIAEQLHAELLKGKKPENVPDQLLFEHIRSLSGPILGAIPTNWMRVLRPFGANGANMVIGNDYACDGNFSVTLPGDLLPGYEFVSTVKVSRGGNAQAAVQPTGFGSTRQLQPGIPILMGWDKTDGEPIRQALQAFREVFPPALCYYKIVPVDEVVTLTLYYREDDHLARLMLTPAEQAKLQKLWQELHFISQDAFALVDAFKQLLEYASQDSNPKLFEPLRQPILARAEAFKKELLASEPAHLNAVIGLANQAYRRPITAREEAELRSLYARLRAEELPHDQAIRLTLARVFVAPAFLYKLEKPGSGITSSPVNNFELANRLSYFLWSSAPDAELRSLASRGELSKPEVLNEQARRLCRDPRARRFAIEFGCQWLHVRGFDNLNEKSERHFPAFANLRGEMYEETIHWLTDFLQSDRSVLDLIDGDYTYLNDKLAAFYCVPNVNGSEWRLVNHVKQYGRGGILGLATTLATQSGASRTSPILRGNWISEVLLGEKLPKPPKGVPILPEDESATAGLTMRQLVEKHSSDAKCAVCHKRIDAYGFSLEGFDAIGARRTKDLAGRPIDVKARAMDGAEFTDIQGLKNYLLTKRKAAFVRQFCKKLLGYALGRGVQLSDEPLLDDMVLSLEKNNYKLSAAIDVIITSKVFREIRGAKYNPEE